MSEQSGIWTIENFLSPKACDGLILFSENLGFREAEVGLPGGQQMMKSIRNNERLEYDDPVLAARLWEKLKKHCPPQLDGWEAKGLNEHFRFYKYEPGQRFKRHIDGRYRRNADEESRITFMVYLNHDYQGGETVFDEVRIVPDTGRALCFIHELKHESTPVTQGTKYVLRSDVMYKKQDRG